MPQRTCPHHWFIYLLFTPCFVPLVGLHLFVFQIFALLKWKSHLYNLLLLFGLGVSSVLKFFSVNRQVYIFKIIFKLGYVKFSILPLYCCICDPYFQNKDTISSSLMQLSVENSELGVAQCPWYFLTLPPACTILSFCF